MIGNEKSFVLMLAIIAGVFTSRAGFAQQNEHSPPNVLFISIDDLNDYISPLDNHPGIVTPNFERLARRSVTFSNAHCAAPACHPSRVAVMTGVHPTTSGIYRNLFGAHGPRWRHESSVLEHVVVLSQHFRDHGYWAAGGGKIFHTLQWTPGDSQNDPDAWDVYRGDPLDPISADWARPQLVPDDVAGLTEGRPLGRSQLFGAAPLELPDEETGDHQVVDWAIDQLTADHDKPFFLAVGLFRPHIPWEVPERWFELYPLDKIQLPEIQVDDLNDAHSHRRESWHRWVVENDQWHHLMRGYLASISYVDFQLGRLLDALDDSRFADNTIIVLWSDHGFHIGEKENWEKFALWDQTTCVPLFIHAPGMSKDGERTHAAATLTDLYPTLCELAGLPIPDQCDGTSLVTELVNPGLQSSRIALTSFVFSGEDNPSHAVCDDRFRLIRYGDGTEEFYDLVRDPREYRNLAQDVRVSDQIQRLEAHIPLEVAQAQAIPVDSPYHRRRRDSQRLLIANRELTISCLVAPDLDSGDGVLVSHGGDHHGYSLYIKDGRVCLTIRRNQVQSTAAAEERAPVEPYRVRAEILASEIRLFIDDRLVGSKPSDGFLLVEPNEGHSVGSDPDTNVGDYQSPFQFHGNVREVKVESESADANSR